MTSLFGPAAPVEPRCRRTAPLRPAPGAPRRLAPAAVERLGRLVLRRRQLLQRPLIAAASFASIAFFTASMAASIACRSAGAQLVARSP